MRGIFRVCAALFFIFCFFSCARVPSPVVYEIVIPTDIYAGLSGEGFFERARITQFYSEKVAREVFSSDKYSVVLIDEAAFAVSPKEKPENVFVLAKVSYTEVMSEAFESAIGAVDSGLLAEIERMYYYPCVPFDEDVTMPRNLRFISFLTSRWGTLCCLSARTVLFFMRTAPTIPYMKASF